MKTFVYFKELGTDTIVRMELLQLLTPGEVISNIEIADPVPMSPDNPLIAVLLTGSVDPTVDVKLIDGTNGVSYGIEVTVTTNLRAFVVTMAIQVNSAVDQLVPYHAQDPSAYKDLLGNIEAGNAAIGTAIFTFPTQIDPSGGYVIWELLDADGTVYCSGNSYEYTIKTTGTANIVMAKCLISVPSNIPPNLDGEHYQLRYTLNYDYTPNTYSDQPVQQSVYSYEQIKVVGIGTVPLGTQPSVEMKGDPATLSLVTETLYDRVGIEIQYNNEPVVPLTMLVDSSQQGSDGPVRVSSGWYYAGTINTEGMPASLEPYIVIWKYWDSRFPNNVYRESAKLFIINSSVADAIDDVKAKINKARTTLYGAPDLLFPPSTILTWLRRGRDMFNGYQGVFTSFTMLNAKGPIREYWLMCAEVGAIQAQYLAEGEKSFDFQGAAIQLSVDKTQYLDTALGQIQGRLDSELKPMKQNLIIKGNTSGDGSADPTQLRRGAIGAVGITITNATGWGTSRYPGAFWMVR